MGLSDIKIHRAVVLYREQPIELRGLCAEDVIFIAQDYGPQMALAFGKVTAGDMNMDVKKVVMDLTQEAPKMVGALIALAADDYNPENVEKATKLPFPVQAQALEAIFNESFYSEADVKKLIESLTRMIAAVSGAMTELGPSPSPIGTGGSGVKLAS